MKYKFGHYFTQFSDTDVKLKYSHKLITETNFNHLKFPLNIDFDISITLDAQYTTFDHSLPNLEIMTSQKNTYYKTLKN